MSNVVNMSDPNQTVQQALEHLTKQANEGQIDSLVAITMGNNTVSKVIAGSHSTRELFEIVGLLEVLKQEISLHLLTEGESQ